MRTLFFFLMFLSLLPTVRTQDYLVSFTATGASSTIDTIHVANLTQGTGLTMNGTDVLHLMGVVGIIPLPQPVVSIAVIPNPMPGTGLIEFNLPVSALTTVTIFDFAGRQICRSVQFLHSGSNTFLLSGVKSGSYSVSVSVGEILVSSPVVCLNSGQGEIRLTYISGAFRALHKGGPSDDRSVIPMQYNHGDQLLIICYSGIYTTVIPLVPTQSMTVPVMFVPCTDAEGNHYATVSADAQVWMAENLNTGSAIPGNLDQTDNGIREKYCFDNADSLCEVYGGLYQWNEVMQYDTNQGVQGLCPDGWHLPADDEWTAMTTFLGGEDVAGGKLKETGFLHWLYPNLDATNSSGFTALCGGWRFMAGNFSSLTTFSYYWTSTQHTNQAAAWYRDLRFDFGYIYRDSFNKAAGYSVRCVLN